MTVSQVKGKPEKQARAGGYALSALASPLNVGVLEALAEGPLTLADLRRAVGSPPQTTMRKHLRILTDIGVLARERQNDFPGALKYELRDSGRALMRVAAVVRDWLAASPEGPITLGTVAAKSAVKALVDGWSTTVLRALAARPLSLTELDALIAGVSYPSLERRLVAMRMAGQVAASPGRSRGTPYAVTEWMRRAVGPLVAAARWERRHLPAETSPISRLDIEASFLLALPLLKLAPEHSGVCRLAVETSSAGNERRVVGAMVGIEEGRVSYCRARMEGDTTAWVLGSVIDWFGAVAEGRVADLETGGDRELVSAILSGLHADLFVAARRKGNLQDE